ncbi:hypothetical protein [Rhodohalobacter sulfatireducens]|uniref:Uncharacterized protein n=1 Tax=Rhodohalobacter sulfatireducens TaxID=2911366 RepID=A0ABS9K931_9BACT|nr:hypothetical protein [Rhodohalobacter sulfatireducens]MCG2587352.1 hypothetical protein [Rhodohalobacter sulfatireducens]
MDLNTMVLIINDRCINFGYREKEWPYPESIIVQSESSETETELIKKQKQLNQELFVGRN